VDFTEKFQQALRIPTFFPAHSDTAIAEHEEELSRFQDLLVELFPVFHSAAERWVLSPYSVVYKLSGSEAGVNAILFTAHYDVVPVEKEKWNTDPFGAKIKDGFVYGRGSLDMKSTLCCILEAAEDICIQGQKPKRDIWFAFGGDEERGGYSGAFKTAQWLENRGLHFEWVLDEGSPIADNHIRDIDTPLALISLEEKGNLSLNLTVEQEPGHASRPPKVQAAAILARALCRIEKKPFPYKLGKTVEMFLAAAGKYIPGIKGFVMRHARAFSIVFGSLFFKIAAANPSIEAMLKTTVAMTMLEGSTADNVMPSQVRAVINLRLLYPWTVESATEFIRKAINDKRVQISFYEPGADSTAAFTFSKDKRNPKISSDSAQNGWKEIFSAMNEVYPGIPLLPFIMVAITDSRHYKNLTNNIFRFSPQKLNPDELNRVHGHYERISLENLNNELLFYTHLLRLI